jgi:hypothetical protein
MARPGALATGAPPAMVATADMMMSAHGVRCLFGAVDPVLTLIEAMTFPLRRSTRSALCRSMICLRTEIGSRDHALVSCLSMILSENPVPTFRDHALAFCWSMILSENRFPLFGIML